MLVFLDQMEMVLRLIGYTKEEIDNMNEWEPIRKVMAAKQLITSIVESVVGQFSSGSSKGHSSITPFNNLGDMELQDFIE